MGRNAILARCYEVGLSLPSSFFTLIEGEGAWSPHVTLGKIRASRAEVGYASCSGAQLQKFAPISSAAPLGLTLHGERPPRAWCDWDGPLAFGVNTDVEEIAIEELATKCASVGCGRKSWNGLPGEYCCRLCREGRGHREECKDQPGNACQDVVAAMNDTDVPAGSVNLTRALSCGYGAGASKYDESVLKEWEDAAKAATEMLNTGRKEKNADTRGKNLTRAAKLFETAADLRPDFVRSYVGGSRALQLVEHWVEAKNVLLRGLEMCSNDKLLVQELQKLEEAAESAGAPLPEHRAFAIQPLPGPGFKLTASDLSARWAVLTWRHEVVAFKGRDERVQRTEARCLSNFYDEEPFLYEIPVAFCVRLGLSASDRSIKCLFSEKAIMLCKAAIMGDSDSYRRIVAADTPFEAKQLGKSVDNWDDAQWQHVLCSVAFDVVWQKFSKTPALQSTLLATGNSLIAEATRADRVWGIGLDKGSPEIQKPSQWRGANILGWALMEVRAELRRNVT